jgi:hypothetical protein
MSSGIQPTAENEKNQGEFKAISVLRAISDFIKKISEILTPR